MDLKFDGVDGKAMVESLLKLQSIRENDQRTMNLINAFNKYGLNTLDGMALLTEILAILPVNEEGDNNDS